MLGGPAQPTDTVGIRKLMVRLVRLLCWFCAGLDRRKLSLLDTEVFNHHGFRKKLPLRLLSEVIRREQCPGSERTGWDRDSQLTPDRLIEFVGGRAGGLWINANHCHAAAWGPAPQCADWWKLCLLVVVVVVESLSWIFSSVGSLHKLTITFVGGGFLLSPSGWFFDGI